MNIKQQIRFPECLDMWDQSIKIKTNDINFDFKKNQNFINKTNYIIEYRDSVNYKIDFWHQGIELNKNNHLFYKAKGGNLK